jgi:hypothetical protein
MVIEVPQARYAFSILALGALGASLSIGLLPLIPADAASTAYGRLLDEPLPNVVFVGAIGFGVGALVAAVWSLACRIMAPQVPPA